jgi:hypothetical protein
MSNTKTNQTTTTVNCDTMETKNQNPKKIQIIHNHQLFDKKYDIETLEYNIDRLALKTLLKTQKLTVDFFGTYLLNPEDHGMSREDHYITWSDVLQYQRHITNEEIQEYKKTKLQKDNNI